jgi:hypothetical protein
MMDRLIRPMRDRAPDLAALEVLLTVKEYADVVRQHPHSIYRSIRLKTFRRFSIERHGRTVLIRVPSDYLRRLRPRG